MTEKSEDVLLDEYIEKLYRLSECVIDEDIREAERNTLGFAKYKVSYEVDMLKGIFSEEYKAWIYEMYLKHIRGVMI